MTDQGAGCGHMNHWLPLAGCVKVVGQENETGHFQGLQGIQFSFRA
eukprot:CAMPEP_0184293838 /NCGR_PEP_ID=MMETSP1049-20130417/5171_1 /TAXON_ID=77928 /ORGANISM="Proteomonas sulcata, Strain CCMP704" /LENGTH=45 /DNA_ID= /DNA_START= /DNA_END= /DNA_ORIENTATION=